MNEDLQRSLVISLISTVAVYYISQYLDKKEVLPGSTTENQTNQ